MPKRDWKLAGRMAAVVGLALTGSAYAINPVPGSVETRPSAWLIAESGKAPPAEAPAPVNAAFEALAKDFPGVQARSWRGRVLNIYGVPMTDGDTPRDAAMEFVRLYQGAFDAGALELREKWSVGLDNDRFHVVQFDQTIGGVHVHLAHLVVVVRGGEAFADGRPRVVLASAKLAKAPFEGLGESEVTSFRALNIAKAQATAQGLAHWHEPTLVAYFGEGDVESWIDPVLAWRVPGTSTDGGLARTYFLDARSGAVILDRNEILHADVSGVVRANVTPNAAGDTPTNPPALRPLQDIRVNSGATATFSNDDGGYTLSLASSGPVFVSASLAQGQWTRIRNTQQPTPIQSASVQTPVPATVDITLNATPSEHTNAQANAFYYQHKLHQLYDTIAPGWTGLDLQVLTEVNLVNSGPVNGCNAFFNPTSITLNYFAQNATCTNSASGGTIGHEYGHFVVERRGLAQNAFGEGFGDSQGMMYFDVDVASPGWFIAGAAPIRDPIAANITYPCTSASNCSVFGSHCCGQMIGAVTRGLRNVYADALGVSSGVDTFRRRFVTWAMITSGGEGANNSAHPGTAIEWLTLDDDDGDLSNGTPNRVAIASVFTQRNITVPAAPVLRVTPVTPLPSLARAGSTLSIRVRIEPGTSQPDVASARLNYKRPGDSTYTAVALQPTGNPSEYGAALPIESCGEIRYYFSVNAVAGPSVTNPGNAPTTTFSLPGRTGVALADSFELSTQGWTTTNESSGLGQWQRGNPNPSAAQPDDDRTPDGVNCWFTGQAAAGLPADGADVDSGRVILTSPAFALRGQGWTLRYWLWYSNREITTAESALNQDTFRTQLSLDGGVTWTTIDSVGPSTASFVGWNQRVVSLDGVAGFAPSENARIRFVAEDAGAASIVEAAVDDVEVAKGGNCNTCLADLDDGSGTGTPDGGVAIEDLLFFLDRFGAGDALADLDDDADPAAGTPDGGVSIEDLLFYLARFAAGC